MDVFAQDKHGDDPLILALKQQKYEAANYLVSLDKYDIAVTHRRTGLNYFGYALQKGCFSTASLMLQQLKAKLEGNKLLKIIDAPVRLANADKG